MTDPTPPTEDPERDAFLEATLPLLIGECANRGSTGWCATHDGAWVKRPDHCSRYHDADDLADRIIKAWEGRKR